MFEIKIYGVISSENGLSAIQQKLESAGGSDILIRINSYGGESQEAFAMYSEIRRYAKWHNAKITTQTDGNCASAATVIFLSGDERILNRYIEPFVHNAWFPMTSGDAKDLQKQSELLEQENVKIAQFYSEHTELTYDEAKELMDNDTFITASEALRLRFATKIEDVARPAALQRFSNSKPKNMSDTTPKFTKEHESILDKFMNLLNGNKPKNLMVYSAANDEIDFPNVENEADIKVGESATIDGQKAEGTYLMKSGETYVFADGKLSEVVEAEDEVETLNAKVAEKDAEIQALQEKLSTAENSANDFKAKYEAATAEMQSHVEVLNKLKNASPEAVQEPKTTPPAQEEKKSRFALAMQKLN